jgi:hypothetical protein
MHLRILAVGKALRKAVSRTCYFIPYQSYTTSKSMLKLATCQQFMLLTKPVVFFKQWLLKYYVYDSVLTIGRLIIKSSSDPQFYRPKDISRCTACVSLEARHLRLHVTFSDKLKLFFLQGATAPSGQRPHHYRGFTITLRHITFGRTPLDEWSAPRRDLYLTTHSTNKKETFMPPVGFEPAIPASDRPQTHALNGAAILIDRTLHYSITSIHNRGRTPNPMAK